MDKTERFEDIFHSVDVSLFIESPSRLIPYMEYHGFDKEEIRCMKAIAEAHPEELSEIIAGNDSERTETVLARLSKVPGTDRVVSASMLVGLRDASDMRLGRRRRSPEEAVISVEAHDNGSGPASKDMLFAIGPEGEASVVRYSGAGQDVMVPDRVTIDGKTYPVTSIDGWAFERRAYMESVRLPPALSAIGDNAFLGCSRLRSFSIPDNVRSIGKDAFEGCINLEWFKVGHESRHYSTDSQGILYSKDMRMLIKAPCGIDGDVVTPPGVAHIGGKAFEGCVGLSHVTIGPGVETIGDWAFSKCRFLRTAVLPESLDSIGNGAFHECTGLTEIHIPGSVKIVGSRAFSGCASMRSASFHEDLRTIEKWAFEGCQSLTEVFIPSTVSSIGDGAFSMCVSLNAYHVDPGNRWYNAVEGLLYDKRHNALIRAPRGTSGSVSILEGTASILERALEGCVHITSVKIPDSVATIGRRAFKGCIGLKSVRLPKSLRQIPDNMFLGCDSLESVEIPPSVAKIGCGAFEDCPSLKQVRLPEHVKSVGYNAFDDDVVITRFRRSPQQYGYPVSFEDRRMPPGPFVSYQVWQGGNRHDAFRAPDAPLHIGPESDLATVPGKPDIVSGAVEKVRTELRLGDSEHGHLLGAFPLLLAPPGFLDLGQPLPRLLELLAQTLRLTRQIGIETPEIVQLRLHCDLRGV